MSSEETKQALALMKQAVAILREHRQNEQAFMASLRALIAANQGRTASFKRAFFLTLVAHFAKYDTVFFGQAVNYLLSLASPGFGGDVFVRNMATLVPLCARNHSLLLLSAVFDRCWSYVDNPTAHRTVAMANVFIFAALHGDVDLINKTWTSMDTGQLRTAVLEIMPELLAVVVKSCPILVAEPVVQWLVGHGFNDTKALAQAVVAGVESIPSIPKKKKTPPSKTKAQLAGLSTSKYSIAVQLEATTPLSARITRRFKLLKWLVGSGADVGAVAEDFVAFLHEVPLSFRLQQHVANFFLSIGVDFTKDYFGTGNPFSKFSGTRPELFRWMLEQDKLTEGGRKYYPDIDRKYTISTEEVKHAIDLLDGSAEVDVAVFLEEMGFTPEQAEQEATENTDAAQLALARIQLQATELLEHAEAGPTTLLDDALRQYHGVKESMARFVDSENSQSELGLRGDCGSKVIARHHCEACVRVCDNVLAVVAAGGKFTGSKKQRKLKLKKLAAMKKYREKVAAKIAETREEDEEALKEMDEQLYDAGYRTGHESDCANGGGASK
jgi:hypothetical protein